MSRDEAIHLVDPAEFDDRFIELSAECSTYEEAYQAVEQEYRSVFRRNRYSNYNSFRNAYNVRRKKRMEEK